MRSLGFCLAEAARHRHALLGLVKTFATIAVLILPIRTDLDSLFTPSFPPQSATSIALQHRWQTRGCKLQCNDIVGEDEGDTASVIVNGVSCV